MTQRNVDLIVFISSMALGIVCALFILSMLTGCGSQARMIIIEGQLSTTGWKEEDRKHKYNVIPNPPSLISGNQSDLTKSHGNVVYDDETYDSETKSEKVEPELPPAKQVND